MKIFFLIFCILMLSSSFLVFSQDNQKLSGFLTDQMKNASQNQMFNDTLKENKCQFISPKKNGDVLISHIIHDLEKEKSLLKHYCSEGCDINVEYEAKMYIKGKIISILERDYYDCKSMASPSNSSKTYNYILFNNQVYNVALKKNDPYLIKLVDSIVKIKFEKDCIQNGILNNNLNLFINKSFFINNPLHSKVCDDFIEIKNAMKYLEFTKMD